ncbi:MAG: nickel pincer cofactor biosynthesis protein LarC [Leptolyngbyaceae bacterium]|nr:nickel pincer cofactor biosynthesis protein LarC [Leptolyngbyaceae bacterium]
MATIAYFDCPTGIAGDMCLGALIDAGVPLDYLTDQLARLGISDEYTLRAETVHRNGQRATKLHVDLTVAAHESPPSHSPDPAHPSDRHPHHPHHHHDHPHPQPPSTQSPKSKIQNPKSRHLPDIEALIHAAQLTPRATEWSLAVFRQLAEAEGAVHGIPPNQVHFHEVGATDAIADIIGTCIGLDWLNVDQIYCSALPTGGGTVWAAHGRLPVPVPAVLHLCQMRQVPVYSNGIQKELVTPTGAAIATTLATAFGPPPAMTIHTIGLGAGHQNLPLPNILRLWIGDLGRSGVQEFGSSEPRFSGAAPSFPPSPTHDPRPTTQTIAVVETHLDDLNPQIIGYLFDQLLAVGALDVFYQGISMKKSRPGILLTVICLPEQMVACEEVIYRETTTLGIRRRLQERSLLHRTFETVATPYGEVSVKTASLQPDTDIINVKPEYDDCARLAQHHQVPWLDVYQAALQQWESAHGKHRYAEP